MDDCMAVRWLTLDSDLKDRYLGRKKSKTSPNRENQFENQESKDEYINLYLRSKEG